MARLAPNASKGRRGPNLASKGRQSPVQGGSLYFVATPIGNLEDITLRAIRVLEEVDLIAAEDTRKTRKLLSALSIEKPLLSLFEANEAKRIPQLIARLQSGEAIAVVTDAGTPTLSDPGFQLNRGCLAAGIPVDVIPGPAAAITALLLSALSPARFRFLGFLPRRGRARTTLLATLADETDTTIFYESARRLAATLGELAELLGAQREIAVVREMTKLHQEVVRGDAETLAARWAEAPPRGEITVVVAGRPAADELADPAAVEAAVRARLGRGERPRQIADALRAAGCPRRMVYQLALTLAGTNDTLE